MKIFCFDPPYSGLSDYVRGSKGFGLNRDGSWQDENCMELMTHFFGTKNMEKRIFRRIAVAAELISDDISVFEPDEYIPIDNQNIETIKLEAMGEIGSTLRNLPVDNRIEFYSSAIIRINIVEQALEKSLQIFSELWPNPSEEDKKTVISHILDTLTAFYPMCVLDKVGDGSLFLSSDPYINKAHAYKIGPEEISAENILTILAISGIEIALPSIYSEDPEIIAEIKERFLPERLEYIEYLRGFLKECYLAVKAGSYKDAWKFAEFNSSNDLLIKLHKFESAVARSDKKLLSVAANNILGKGVSIAQSVLSGNFVGAGWDVISALVTSLNGGTERSKAHADYLMVSYAFQIKDSLKRG